jgi:hypothetical protein
MRASAELAGDRLEIVTVPGSSHFVLFDEPRLFDLPRARGRCALAILRIGDRR